MLDALLLTAALTFQVADTSLTYHNLSKSNVVEANPVMRGRVVPVKIIVNGGLLVGYFKTKKKSVKRGIAISMLASGAVGTWSNLR